MNINITDGEVKANFDKEDIIDVEMIHFNAEDPIDMYFRKTHKHSIIQKKQSKVIRCEEW